MIPTTEIKTIPASKAHSLQKRVILYCEDVGMHKDLSELNVGLFCNDGKSLKAEEKERLGWNQTPQIVNETELSAFIGSLL